MSNVLSNDKRKQVLALGELGWSLRLIEEKTGVRRETASAYLRSAGIAVRSRGGRPREWPRKPATTLAVSTDPGSAKPATTAGVSTDLDSKPAITEGVSTDSERAKSHPARAPGRAPSASACEPFRDLILEALDRGRNAMAIWQGLVDDHGFRARYSSVKRFVLKLRGSKPADARVVITTDPGAEAQVDYGGDGPMVRDAGTGKYRRMRLFVLTLGYLAEVRSSDRAAIQRADLGRAARTCLSPAGRSNASRRARQPRRGCRRARRVRPHSQSALPRRFGALRCGRPALSRQRS